MTPMFIVQAQKDTNRTTAFASVNAKDYKMSPIISAYIGTHYLLLPRSYHASRHTICERRHSTEGYVEVILPHMRQHST